MEGKIHPCCFLSRHQFFSRIIARSFVDTTREIHRLSISSHLTRNSPHHNRLPTLIIHQVRETGRSLDRPRITCLFNGTTTAVAIDPRRVSNRRREEIRSNEKKWSRRRIVNTGANRLGTKKTYSSKDTRRVSKYSQRERSSLDEGEPFSLQTRARVLPILPSSRLLRFLPR